MTGGEQGHMADKQKQSADVTLRTDRSGAIILLIIATVLEALTWVVVHARPNKDPAAAWILMALPLPFFGLAIWAAVVGRSHFVRAGASELTWCLNKSKGCATWRGVTDYFEREAISYSTSTGQKPQIDLFLVTGSCEIVVSSALAGDRAAFRALVEQNATASRSRSWGQHPSGPLGAGSRTFAYGDRKSQVRRAKGVLATTLAYMLLTASRPFTARHSIVRDMAFMDWPMRAGEVCLVLAIPVMSLAFGLGWWLTVCLPAWRRQNERITVTADSITWEDGRSKVMFPWADVTDYYIDVRLARGPQPTERCVVRTGDRQIEFTSVLAGRGHYILKTIVKRYACNASTLGPARVWIRRSAPTRAETLHGSGAATFRYGTRFVGYALAFPLCYGLVIANLVARSGAGWWAYAGHAVITCTVIWICLASAIDVDDSGLTHRTPFGRRSILWTDIVDYYDAKGVVHHGVIVSRSGARLNIWPWLETYYVFREEVALRAPKPAAGWTATGPSGRGIGTGPTSGA
jgi:hypothetical protein